MSVIPLPFEFVIFRRPVSCQAKSKGLKEWKNFVRSEVKKFWEAYSPIQDTNLQLTIVYFCDENPLDTDNIIKPIQDALVGLVFENDSLISDVDSHRRFISGSMDVFGLSSMMLIHAMLSSLLTKQESVYVKVSESQHEENTYE